VMKPTLTWAKRTLKAVEELIGQYKDGTHDGGTARCPLCIIARFDKYGRVNCKKCPWVIFKGYTCMEIPNEEKSNYGYSNYRYYSYYPVPLRLRRLYGWRLRLQNMIRKFEEAA